MTDFVVINACFGGFGLSDAAVRRYAEIKNIPIFKTGDFWGSWCTADGTPFVDCGIERTDPALVQVVRELGHAADGGVGAELCIVEVPAGVAYRIHEYDGSENIEIRDEIEWTIAK